MQHSQPIAMGDRDVGMGGAIHGRDRELVALRKFVNGAAGQALILTGVAGAGKTTLWEAGCAIASDLGQPVLATRARDAEASLAFAGLGDMLDGVDRALIDALPAPQRTALDVALLQAEPDGPAPEPRAVGVALLGVLRALAVDDSVLVAVDDLQWLDGPTVDALRSRRAGWPVCLSGCWRPSAGGVEMPFSAPADTTRIEVGAVASDALGRVLLDRLGLRLRRPVLLELHRLSQGNPLFALEVGRILSKDGVPHAGEPLPHPDVGKLVDTHISELPTDVCRAVLATALSAKPWRSELEAVAGEEALHAALLEGVLVVEGDRVRPAHPLLGSAAIRAASPAERRAMHADLAAAAGDDHRHARHKALAADGPDAQLGAYLAAAGGRAGARGAAAEAVALAEHAVRLTPVGARTRSVRVLELAEHLARAGNADRYTELLRSEQQSLATPTERARAHLLLCDGTDVDEIVAFEGHIEAALAEDAVDPEIRGRALARRATAVAVLQVERLAAAETWAVEALEAARGAWPDVQHDALQALAWVRVLRGLPVDDLDEEATRLEDRPSQLHRSLDRVVALRLGWRGEVGRSRQQLQRLAAIAEERGDERSSTCMRQHLVELELRVGDCRASADALDRYEATAVDHCFLGPTRARVRALLAATRGDARDTERFATEAIAGAERNGVRWDLLESWRAQGVGALVAGEPERAAEVLWRVWEHMREQRVEEPGAFPVAIDLAEALVGVDRIDDATEVLDHLADLAERHEHPWALASAHRGRALVHLARDDDEDVAAQALADAAESYARHGLRHDTARTLLALGRAQRRRRKWGAARRALEQSVESFSAAGAEGWAAVARAELERVGARRPPADPDELTPAERRVVELAAAGHANKAIAQTLVVTVSTVEAHLTRAYGKLGVHSRTQLAERIGWSKTGGFTN